MSAVDAYKATHKKKDRTKKSIKMIKKLDAKCAGLKFFKEVRVLINFLLYFLFLRYDTSIVLLQMVVC